MWNRSRQRKPAVRLTGFILGGALLLAGPATARAQLYITPYVAGNFGGTGSTLVPSATKDANALTVGGTGGVMMGWIGVEADVAYANRFFNHDGNFVETSSLWTAMGNARVSIPLLEDLHPYASAGVGMIRPNIVEQLGLATATGSRFGWNAGAGLNSFFTEHAGLQGDVRYFRARDKNDTNSFGIDFNGLDFWRASIGAAFKW